MCFSRVTFATVIGESVITLYNVDLFAASAVQEELVSKCWMLVANHSAIMLAITKYQDAALVPMCRTENAPSRIYGNSIQATF